MNEGRVEAAGATGTGANGATESDETTGDRARVAVDPPRIRRATSADCDAVAALLHGEFASTVASEAFRRLFAYRWRDVEPDYGLVVEVHGRVVGFLGTVYSQRTTDAGQRYTVCSLSSWYVQPAYRSMGLALLLKCINQKGVSVISLSPNQNALPVYLKCGMKQISEGFELYLPWLGSGGGRARVITNLAEIRALLPEREQRMLDDHLPYHCGHYAVQDDSGVAYIITKRRIRTGFPRVPISEALYFSEGPIVHRHFRKLVRAVCLHDRAAGLAVDRSLLGDTIPAGGKFRERLRVGRGGDLALAARDSAYSEIMLLD